jgi:hypothetical protein
MLAEIAVDLLHFMFLEKHDQIPTSVRDVLNTPGFCANHVYGDVWQL